MIFCSIQEDYIDEETKSTSKSSVNNSEPSLPVNIQQNRQISHMPSVSDSRIPSSNMIDELIPALNQFINVPPSSSASSVSKHMEPTIVPPPLPTTATVDPPIITPIAPGNVSLRSSNKSFSNRLGMIMSSSPSQNQNSVVQPSKPTSLAHQYPPPLAKQPTIPPLLKNSNESCAKPIPPTSLIPKCKLLFIFPFE